MVTLQHIIFLLQDNCEQYIIQVNSNEVGRFNYFQLYRLTDLYEMEVLDLRLPQGNEYTSIVINLRRK